MERYARKHSLAITSAKRLPIVLSSPLYRCSEVKVSDIRTVHGRDMGYTGETVCMNKIEIRRFARMLARAMEEFFTYEILAIRKYRIQSG